MKVFLDTNVLVSAFATRGLSAEVFELIVLEHELITGGTVLTELKRVLRGKFKLPATRCAEIAEFVASESARVVRNAAPADCKADPDDRRILGEAIAGKVEVFVTGDAALVALGSVSSIAILTPRQFWERLRSR